MYTHTFPYSKKISWYVTPLAELAANMFYLWHEGAESTGEANG